MPTQKQAFLWLCEIKQGIKPMLPSLDSARVIPLKQTSRRDKSMPHNSWKFVRMGSSLPLHLAPGRG